VPSLNDVVDELVAANRILAGLAVVDAFGHVSARHPQQADRFLLSRSMAPELVTAGDIMTFDLAANAQDGDTRAPYLERFIHAEIYARRPDVQAIVHSHATGVIPFSASSVPLMPIHHMAGFLSTGAPVFEIRERFGTTDMLVRTQAQGSALAESLGTGSVVLMRGHGFCTVGESVPIAVYRAYYTQSNADIQQRAIALGGSVTYLDPDEALEADETNNRVIAKPWELWKRQFASK
jgi:ribulose-5-phosphate 4-epimerase/fuculose-1-phosphate aldolase